jgi:hypothetical protein
VSALVNEADTLATGDLALASFAGPELTTSGSGRYQLIETIDIPSSSSRQTFSFDGLSGSQFELEYRFQPTTSGDCWLRFNNNDEGDVYDYFDETGSPSNGNSDLLLCNNSSAAQVAGTVEITETAAGRIGISHDIQTPDVQDISSFSTTGGFSNNLGGLSSIQFSTPSAEDTDPSEVLLRRID